VDRPGVGERSGECDDGKESEHAPAVVVRTRRLDGVETGEVGKRLGIELPLLNENAEWK